jgi:hypothetical protein
MASDARKLVELVLGGHMTSQVWTSTYTPVFPFTPQGFSVGAVLPMVFYLFRWGHRRGKGRFTAAFGPGKPTVTSVVERLICDDRFSGFASPVTKIILGDVLLTSSLENKRHAEGHLEQVQRCFPNHFLSSWIDLPSEAGHLRNVPEMLVSLINDQPSGEKVVPFQEQGRYRVGSRIADNDLLQIFAAGVATEGDLKSGLKSDRFDETALVGLDQLIMVRLAQHCGEAPVKAAGKGEPGPIPNQRPIAKKAAKYFREDLLVFLDCYGRGNSIPRAPLLSMLESALSIGLTSIVVESAALMEKWSQTGELDNQNPDQMQFFIDCSNWSDIGLRGFSEQSSATIRQMLSRMPMILMYARLLDHYVRTEADIERKDLPLSVPDATAWIELLGSFVNQTHEEALNAEKFFRAKSRALLAAAEVDPDSGFRTDSLSSESALGTHGRRLAEALTGAFEQVAGGDKLNQFLTSALMIDETNGLARRRKVTARSAGLRGTQRAGDAISFVLTNSVLEYLVHRHLRNSGKGRKHKSLSYPEFLRIIRERYGFYVDQSPPNMQVPSELLQSNRRHLERRLRDLGLLSGVNDAERMKKLKPRYLAVQDANDAPGEDA